MHGRSDHTGVLINHDTGPGARAARGGRQKEDISIRAHAGQPAARRVKLQIRAKAPPQKAVHQQPRG